MVYYVYVQEKDGSKIIYGQSQDIFEANKIAKRQGKRDTNMLPFGAMS